MSKLTKSLSIIALALILVITISMLAPRLLRPPRSDHVAELFQGVSYTRQARETPRPLMIHIVEIDLQAPGIGFLVTPGDSTMGLEVPARTTSAFVEEFDLQVAINGSFFKPFRAGTFLWDFYPLCGPITHTVAIRWM